MKHMVFLVLLVSFVPCSAMEHVKLSGNEEQQLAETAYQVFCNPITQDNSCSQKTGIIGVMQWLFGGSSNREQEKHDIAVQAMARMLEQARQQNPDQYEGIRQKWRCMSTQHQNV